MSNGNASGSTDFIREIIDEHNRTGRFGGACDAVSARAERLPAHRPRQVDLPELRHRRGLRRACSTCALTTPTRRRKSQEYVDSIIEDVRWLGVVAGDARRRYARRGALRLGLFRPDLRVGDRGDSQAARPTCATCRPTRSAGYRGTLTEPGKDSPYRNRSVEENLDLFERMRKGEFPDGSRTLRAKIDMASPNLNLRDPVMYRILHATHHRTGDTWCIYPMYDWAHGIRGFDRGDHALDLHAGVREPPAAVRLVPGDGERGPDRRRQRTVGEEDPPSAADRVCPAQPDLHGDEQAEAAASWCRRGTCGAGTIRGCRRSAGLRRRGYTPEAIRSVLRDDRRVEGRERGRLAAAWSTASART